MENITSAAELKLAIQTLEFERDIQGKILKEQIFATLEDLKPVNLIKSSLNEIISSPHMIDNMLGAIMGMVSGYVSKKIAVGTSHNLIRKILGSVLQFGITNVVSQHTSIFKTAGNFILDKFIHKHNTNQARL